MHGHDRTCGREKDSDASQPIEEFEEESESD